MKQSNERRIIAGQSNSAQKPQKHDVNLQKNSTLYFQVGIIVCLLVVYGLFQMKFERKLPKKEVAICECEYDTTYPIEDFKVYEEVEAEKQEQKKVQKLLTAPPIEKPDDFKMSIPTDIITEPKPTSQIADIGDIKNLKKDVEPVELPWNIDDVEKIPIYPGCEKAKTNDQRKQCMSEKLSKLVLKNFDQNLFSELGLYGVQRINVQFTIDKTGNVIDIKARAPQNELIEEALRVAQKIPAMKPGLQRARPVSVIYNLPIVLKVQ